MVSPFLSVRMGPQVLLCVTVTTVDDPAAPAAVGSTDRARPAEPAASSTPSAMLRRVRLDAMNPRRVLPMVCLFLVGPGAAPVHGTTAGALVGMVRDPTFSSIRGSGRSPLRCPGSGAGGPPRAGLEGGVTSSALVVDGSRTWRIRPPAPGTAPPLLIVGAWPATFSWRTWTAV